MEAGEVGADGHTQERSCLNCGTALVGDYCYACGQHAHVHRTISSFFHDLLHGVLHFEGRIWRTLPLLAWRPGELTRRYIEGQRARFVSPIALFLFSVFLMFAVLSWMGGVPRLDSEQIKSEMAREVKKSEAAISVLGQQRARAASAGQPTTALDRKLADARSKLRTEREIAERGLGRGATVRVSDDVPNWLRGPLEKAGRNPELLLYKVKTSAYKWSWAIIPLSVPFLWLLFPFSRRFRLYDHTVFVTYSLCFMTLLVCVASVVGATGLPVLAGLAMLVPPVHIYRQLRETYALGWVAALWRTLVLMIVAIAVLAMFAVGLFGAGLFE